MLIRFCHHLGFNPLSTGHARRSWHMVCQGSRCFNPLSTGHALKAFLAHVNKPFEFQSPIYGSRTLPMMRVMLVSSCFNPLSTGHAQCVSIRTPPHHWVSIPYLRVTHAVSFVTLSAMHMFQSPIYGSRTRREPVESRFHTGFNPLSTGHALAYSPVLRSAYIRFNPLSTGHAPGNRL